MPQLIFYACKKETVQKLSKRLPPLLAQACDTPEDWFSFAWSPNEFYIQGENDRMDPLVEIKQFQRPVEQEKRVADLVFEALREEGYASSEVYFLYLPRSGYYEASIEAC